MHQLTLRPVWKFNKALNRDYLTPGDFAQLKGQIQRQIDQKKGAGQNVSREELYLSILQGQDFFAGARQITTAEFNEQIHEQLVRDGYAYVAKNHLSRHSQNSFYSYKTRSGNGKLYDLAFYNANAQNHRRGHHTHQGYYSIFYMRCEERGDRILFGNLQIDDKGREDWENKLMGQELRRPKNIYRMMIQQAVKHALARGKKNILFQAGDACEISQWRKSNYALLTVTEKNFALVMKTYHEHLARFSAAPGVFFKNKVSGEYWEVIVKSGAGSYQTRRCRNEPPKLLYHLMMSSGAKAYAENPRYAPRASQVVWDALLIMRQRIEAGAAPKVIQTQLEKLLTDLTGVVPPPWNAAAQTADLAKIMRAKKWVGIDMWYKVFTEQIEKYLIKWGYDKYLLAQFRSLKRLPLQGKPPEVLGSYIYYNSRQRDGRRCYQQKDYIAPELGKSYLVYKNDKYDINYNKLFGKASRQHTYTWYETTIPAELKKLNLGFEKIKIRTVKDKNRHQAHAWRITSGTKEFAQRPVIVF